MEQNYIPSSCCAETHGHLFLELSKLELPLPVPSVPFYCASSHGEAHALLLCPIVIQDALRGLAAQEDFRVFVDEGGSGRAHGGYTRAAGLSLLPSQRKQCLRRTGGGACGLVVRVGKGERGVVCVAQYGGFIFQRRPFGCFYCGRPATAEFVHGRQALLLGRPVAGCLVHNRLALLLQAGGTQ